MKSRAFMLIRALCLLVPLSLGGCDPFTIAQVEAVSVMGSDKTVIDHAVSIGSGKDCSTIRKERGMTYCVEDEKIINPKIFCYRDLGRVTCYDRPDPYRNAQQRVDMNDHNRPK
ncbi:MAG: hypothetical protein O2944_04400 [Proteobacteria bacterium]|nr:hypothetical protein [Pseudomonadota bacterium]